MIHERPAPEPPETLAKLRQPYIYGIPSGIEFAYTNGGMAGEQRRVATCRVCGNPDIRASYRAVDVVYLECEQCGAVWAVTARTSEKRIQDVSIRLKTKHGTVIH